MRESDGTHFLYNGEGCVRVSPLVSQYRSKDLGATVDSPRWHNDYGEIDQAEKILLDSTLDSSRKRTFELIGYGRYQVIARGEFRE